MDFPRQLNIGSGKNFRDDFLNLDINDYWKPDIVFDLNEPFFAGSSRTFHTDRFGEIRIEKNTFKKIIAFDVLEHIRNLTGMMTSCLELLEEGGIISINVPYDLSYGAWQDPTHVRAFNERSWLYYTDWFWYLDWKEYRFVTHKLNFTLSPIGVELQKKGMDVQEILRMPRAVDSMYAELRKIRLTENDLKYMDYYRSRSKPAVPGKAQVSNAPYCIWIVTTPGYIHSHVFDEVAIGLKAAFARLGHDIPIVRDVKEVKGKAIVLGCNFIPKINMTNLPENMILFNMEQVYKDSPWMGQGYVDLLKKYPVWDYSWRNIRALKEMGVPNVTYCGIGYEPELSRIPQVQEDIDVLFYGSLNERRKVIVNELRKNGIRAEAVFGIYGEERDKYIARSKIVLNIHFYDACIFEIVRISFLLANRKFVISEEGKDEQEKDFADGLVICPYEKIVENCMKYLADEKARKEIAEKGFEIIKKYPQSAFVRQALGIL